MMVDTDKMKKPRAVNPARQAKLDAMSPQERAARQAKLARKKAAMDTMSSAEKKVLRKYKKALKNA